MKKNVVLSTALKIALAAAVAATMPLQLSHAASSDGSLVGKITTSDNSSLAGVELTVRNPETGFSRTVKADADGQYRFAFLPVGKYVLAHAYSDLAVRNAIEAGVRSIEHGNLIREAAAKAIKSANASLVPTMVTYEAIFREGKRYGIGDHQIAKIDLARQQSLQGLRYAYNEGCKIGSGSDLLGDIATQRAVEFELKGQIMKPMEVLLSATKINAEIFRMSDRIGSVEPNKYADLIVVQGNPLKNLRAFQVQDNLRVIMKAGRLYKHLG